MLTAPSPSASGRPGRSPWLLRRPDPLRGARLFLLPYSGCGASMYHRWPRAVEELEVCPVQLPGRENRVREAIPDTYQELAAALVDGLTSYLDRPFVLFGHCGSALLAFEVAARLTVAGGPLPTAVIVSSQVAPSDGPAGRYLSMTDDELAEEMAMLIRSGGGDPLPAIVALGLRTLRADVEMNKRYRPATVVRVPSPVTAIGWDTDVEVPADTMAGWSRHAATAFHRLPGGHHRFLDAPPELTDVILRAHRDGVWDAPASTPQSAPRSTPQSTPRPRQEAPHGA